MDVEIVRLLTILLLVLPITGLVTGLVIMDLSFRYRNPITSVFGYTILMVSLAMLIVFSFFIEKGRLWYGASGAVLAMVLFTALYVFAYKEGVTKSNTAAQPSEAVTTDAAS